MILFHIGDTIIILFAGLLLKVLTKWLLFADCVASPLLKIIVQMQQTVKRRKETDFVA
jgi:hypothetical protein